MKTAALLLRLGVALTLGSACRSPQGGPPIAPTASTAPAAPPAALAASVTAPPTPPAPPSEVPGCPPREAGDPPVPFGAEEMVPLCRDVYVEPALTPDERARVARLYAASLDDVARGLGPLESAAPLAVLCKTRACSEHFVGTHMRSTVIAPGHRATGAAYVGGARVTIAIIRIDDAARGVLAHERVHVEAHVRLGHGRVPTWFNEGLAVVVGGEPTCAGHEDVKGIDDLRRLVHDAAWADYTNTANTMEATYCQARAEVGAWLRRAGKVGLLDLIARVRDGASFDDVYGPMQTQGGGPLPTVVVSSAPTLGDPTRPFSLAMWIKPAARTGTLAHVSATPVGTGFCGPFLGYDREQRIVSQVFHGDGPDLASFAVAVDPKPRPLGRWTHVAMTWAPGSPNRLYVGGSQVAEAKAPRYHAPGAGPPLYVAWGSINVGGTPCWPGAVSPGAFHGSVTETRVNDTELGPAEIAALARTPP